MSLPFSSIEPNLLTDDLIDFVASSRAFMPHFHFRCRAALMPCWR